MVNITVDIVSPDRPDAMRLIQALDDYLLPLYPPDSNYLLDVKALMQPNIKFVLAFAQQEAVGCGAVRFFEDYAELKRMYVHPTWRKHGIGYRILEKLEMLVSEAGLSTMCLETGIYQPEAIRFYERTGFLKCQPFGSYPDDPLSGYYKKQLAL